MKGVYPHCGKSTCTAAVLNSISGILTAPRRAELAVEGMGGKRPTYRGPNGEKEIASNLAAGAPLPAWGAMVARTLPLRRFTESNPACETAPICPSARKDSLQQLKGLDPARSSPLFSPERP